jgi:cell division protein FtsL
MQGSFRSILNSRFLFIGTVVAAVYIAVNTVHVIARNWQLQQEIATLRGEIELLSAENERLSYDIAYFKTDQYLEQAARQKLNLKAPGETVTVVGSAGPAAPTEKSSQPAAGSPKSNWQAWIDFLSGRQH